MPNISQSEDNQTMKYGQLIGYSKINIFSEIMQKTWKGYYNQFHNILTLFNVLPNFSFTTSETMASITYKHGIYEFAHELPNSNANVT